MKPTLLIATNGTIWHWSCGWRLMHRPKGARNYTQHPRSPVFGHTTFRKCISILEKHQPEAKEILLEVEKPGQPWRRFVGGCLYDHFLYGSVRVRATDGMHAVVEDVDGNILTVVFDNLAERKLQPELKRAKVEKPKPKKEAKATADRSALLARLMKL